MRCILRVGIVGYGNLGSAVELLSGAREDVEIVGVFTRRDDVKTRGAPAFGFKELDSFKDNIDVLAVCHGSSQDVPRYVPELLRSFNTVDAYDCHLNIDKYKDDTDRAAKKHGHTAAISFGWDPGLLSVLRLYLDRFIPNSVVNTFWGRGVSQGHSEALRRIDGVVDAVEYTVPRPDAITLASLVSHPLDDVDRHKRVCYIVAEKGKEDFITNEVLSMQNYFYGYETELHFIDESDFKHHKTVHSHRGRIYALGSSGAFKENKHSALFDIDISSNPELTAHIMLEGAIACHKLFKNGKFGAFSILDIAPEMLIGEDRGSASYL